MGACQSKGVFTVSCGWNEGKSGSCALLFFIILFLLLFTNGRFGVRAETIEVE